MGLRQRLLMWRPQRILHLPPRWHLSDLPAAVPVPMLLQLLLPKLLLPHNRYLCVIALLFFKHLNGLEEHNKRKLYHSLWQMQQGRRSASMKASYEALQQLTQGTDLGLLATPAQAVALPPSEIREVAANQVVVATTTVQSTKKQKKYIHQVVVVSIGPFKIKFSTCTITERKSRSWSYQPPQLFRPWKD